MRVAKERTGGVGYGHPINTWQGTEHAHRRRSKSADPCGKLGCQGDGRDMAQIRMKVRR